MKNMENLPLILSIVSLAGTLLNVWLKMQITIDLQRSEKMILESIEKRFIPREIVELRLQGMDERALHMEARMRLVEGRILAG